MINIYKFIGKKDKTYELEDEQKLNANCKDSEKNGTGPGSCGGVSRKSSEESTTKPSKMSNIVDGKKLESGKLGNLKFPKRAVSGAKEAAMYKIS